MPDSDLISGLMLHCCWITPYIENGEGIFGLLQRLSILWGNIGFVAAKSNARSVADGEGETESHKLSWIRTRQQGRMKECEMAHPCDNNCIVVIAHSLHHTHARDESQDDEGSGYAKKCYDDCKHRRSTILHRQSRWVGHDCSRHSCSASPNFFMESRV